MAITVFGAGAIGGLLGAHLARAGEDVLMVDKVAEHVEAMNNRGLKITGGADFTARVRACLPSDLKGPLGLTFLAVKSYDTGAALDVLAPLVGPETAVVSMQNGLNEPRIAARIGSEHTVGAFVNYGGDWLGPGHIEHGGKGAVYIGELDGQITERLQRIQALLSNLHPTHMTDNIYGYLWSKQTFRSLLAAQALTNETMGGLFGNKRFQPLLIKLVSEAVAVALALGVKLESFSSYEPLKLHPRSDADWAEAMAAMDRVAHHELGKVKVRSGVWRDLAVRKRRTEVDTGVAEVAALGEQHGLQLPLNTRLVKQIKEIEQGVRPQRIENLEELEKET